MKHYVYSARTTDEGLALINKARGDRGWDSFVNEAVAEHYGLDPAVINLPPSRFLTEREEKRKAREAEKAKSATKKNTKEKPKESEKKAARETAKETGENGNR